MIPQTTITTTTRYYSSYNTETTTYASTSDYYVTGTDIATTETTTRVTHDIVITTGTESSWTIDTQGADEIGLEFDADYDSYFEVELSYWVTDEITMEPYLVSDIYYIYADGYQASIDIIIPYANRDSNININILNSNSSSVNLSHAYRYENDY